MPAQTTLVGIGDVLANKYRVDRVLGIGGMGMVVAATHLELEQSVALKFMLPSALESAEATDRFLREARAAVRLRSEHICRVLDVGKLDSGAPYIVMEYMEGQDFAEIIAQRGPLSEIETVDLMMQALEGVADAHANQIVHRDLKPSNLFVAQHSDGSPLLKILDFGISKSSVGVSATKTGELMGSPAYMAPEQMVSSKDVDARADIWSLGVIAYQAVSGIRPFDADSLPALCMVVMNSPPPPLQTSSPAFSNIVMRCLAKDRNARYPDVGALALALAPLGSHGADLVAAKIARVMRRTPPQGTPTLQTGPTAVVAATQPSHIMVPEIGRDTTFGGGAGEAVRLATSRPRSRRWKVAIAGVVTALAALVTVIFAFSSNGSADREPDRTFKVPVTRVADPDPAPAPAVVPPPAVPQPAPPPPPPVDPPAPPPVASTPPPVAPKSPKVVKVTKVVAPKPSPVTKPADMKPTEPAPVESQWTHMHHDGKQ